MDIIFLADKVIFLRPLSPKDDIRSYVRWLHDQEVTLYMSSGKFPTNDKKLKEYISNYSNNMNGMLLGIFIKKSKRHIGTITMHHIDWINRYAKMGVMIGDKSSWGKGYASRAIRLLVNHAFNKMNLNTLYAGVAADNISSIRVFEKVGFKKEGALENHFYLNDKYVDCYLMGLTKRRFN
ncbi:GNAT family N-acetyltransferase [Candidatus Omnitrophota bacterium]